MTGSFRDLKVYQSAFEAARAIFHLSKKFPKEETYSLTDQIRRSSRSVCANIGEGYRKRIYPKHFTSKMTDADGEATETSIWLDFALDCGYIEKQSYDLLFAKYEEIAGCLMLWPTAQKSSLRNQSLKHFTAFQDCYRHCNCY
ncbi:four helix bundle protein [Mucilaginibacter gilvus]|uniref:Four helix bundle protein n=1 Tax=Mucilaginibacter gilvus TaxID=2305909 RepID=A0A3S3ZAQ1_9SPHI|nr:four helix bundle protein [Mucilaginibacter gilvus]RWY57225.1 four helix bundle protein [Mucilaginibacter gilvus]